MIKIKEFIEVYGQIIFGLVLQMSFAALGWIVVAMDYTFIFITNFVTTAFTFCYDHGLTPLHIAAFVASVFITWQTVKFFYYFTVLTHFLTVHSYLKLFGRKNTYPKLNRFNEFAYAVERKIKDEGAFAKNELPTVLKGTPKGVVQVFVYDPDMKTTTFVGHAAFVNNKFLTVYHIVERAVEDNLEVLVGTTESGRSLKVAIDMNSIDLENDTVEFHVGNIPSILGLKMLTPKFLNLGYVSYYHFDSDSLSYTMASVVPDKYDKAYPTFVFTCSNTAGGDSGLPIIQNGKFVASHKGGKSDIKRNVHVIHHNVVRAEITTTARKKSQILNVDAQFKNESPKTYDKDAQERAQDIEDKYYADLNKAVREDEENRKIARTRGEDVDDQGFRKTKEEIRAEKEAQNKNAQPKGKGKGGKRDFAGPVPDKPWGDIDDEIKRILSNIKNETTDEEENLKGKALKGAIQILKEENEKLQKQLLDQRAQSYLEYERLQKKSLTSEVTPSPTPPKPSVRFVLEKSEPNPAATKVDQAPSQHPSGTSSTKDTKKTSSGEKRKKRFNALKEQIKGLKTELQNSTSPLVAQKSKDEN
jgi:hypothetical protein